jgi:putative ABC transport system ATP-binding protein
VPLIDVRHLKKTYVGEGAETPALVEATFSIDKGEFVSIMGPSGSGKSTLLHMLGFLDQPTAGEYFFDGKPVDAYSDDERAHIRNKKMGFVFQTFNLLPRTTVHDNIKLPLLYSSVPEEQWDELALTSAAAVGLGHRLSHDVSELSGGERQRVAIARALINDPEVIFADEPTGSLDSKAGDVVMEIFKKLHQEQKHTIVLITHERRIGEQAQRMLRVEDGILSEVK